MSALDLWFLAGVFIFLTSALAHLLALWRRGGRSLLVARHALTLGLVYWPLLLSCWWLQRGGEGFNRLTLGASAWGVAGLYSLSVKRAQRLEQLGSVASVIAATLGGFAFLFTRPISLNEEMSVWALYGHISLATLGLTAFSVSAGAGAFYLWAERRLKSKQMRAVEGGRLPSLITLDELSLKGLLVGFPLYTLALLIGSVQALKGQGELQLSYVVASAAWLIYGGVLQARLTAGWRGRRAAWLTLTAFAALLTVLALYSMRS